MKQQELRTFMKEQISEKGSQSAAAGAMGITINYLNRLLNQDEYISRLTVNRFAEYCGFETHKKIIFSKDGKIIKETGL